MKKPTRTAHPGGQPDPVLLRHREFVAVFERIASALERLGPPLTDEEKFVALLRDEAAAKAAANASAEPAGASPSTVTTEPAGAPSTTTATKPAPREAQKKSTT